jgi:hypothetical protein
MHHILCLSKSYKNFFWRAAGRIVREHPEEFIEVCLVQLKLSLSLPLSQKISDSDDSKFAQQLNLTRSSTEDKKMIISRALANISSIRDTADSSVHFGKFELKFHTFFLILYPAAMKRFENEIKEVLNRLSHKLEFSELIQGAHLGDLISADLSSKPSDLSTKSTENNEIQYEGWEKL